MKALCFVLIALLLLVPLVPELFGMTLNEVSTLKNSDNVNQIEDAITTGVATIGTTLDVFGVIVEVIDVIATAPVILFRIGAAIVEGWIK